MSCGYCQTDNVTGIDLRPAVDSARSEQASLERTLKERTRARLIWGSASFLAGAALAGSATLWGLSAAALRPVDVDIIRQMSRSHDAADLQAEELQVEYRDGRARVIARIINPNPGAVHPPTLELKLYDERDELLHVAELEKFFFRRRGGSSSWTMPPTWALPLIVEVEVESAPARAEISHPRSLLSINKGLIELPIEETKLDGSTLTVRGPNDTPWLLDAGTLVVALNDPDGRLVDAEYVAVEAAPLEAWEAVVALPEGSWTHDQIEAYGWFWLPW